MDGDVKIYKFSASNNWIDYAKDGDENIVTNGCLYFVKTPEGLSWIAAKATNEWISGQIVLATNIDLTAHNWTPIAGFSGLFNGDGWEITGLNNTNRYVDLPGGEYIYGPTNEWGRTTYGLFGTATNATFTGVTFAGVAISNLSHSVAALAGELAGNCAVSNVTVESGTIRGLGGTAAALAGLADFDQSLVFICNTNRADIAAESDEYGQMRVAAGLLCVAGPTNAVAPYGTVIVTNNANYGSVSTTLFDTDLFGGNLAEILAGARCGALFGDVILTNNLAAGAFEPTLACSDVNHVPVPEHPAVNLASCFWGSVPKGDDRVFYTYLEANAPGSVPVDPVRHTARMLTAIMQNGVTNEVGLINDEITARPHGSVVTLENGLVLWGGVTIDRDIALNLNGKTIFTLYTNDTITVEPGVNATVSNGTIVVGLESAPYNVCEGAHLTTSDVQIEYVDGDFYERTVVQIGDCVDSVIYLTSESVNLVGTAIQLSSEGNVSIDVEKGVILVAGTAFLKLEDCYAFRPYTYLGYDYDGNEVEMTGYNVTLADNASGMPTMKVTIGTEINVAVGNTFAGVTYTLQKKDSLAAEGWTDVEGQSVSVEVTGTPVNLVAPKVGATGYYRVLATVTPSAE